MQVLLQSSNSYQEDLFIGRDLAVRQCYVRQQCNNKQTSMTQENSTSLAEVENHIITSKQAV